LSALPARVIAWARKRWPLVGAVLFVLAFPWLPFVSYSVLGSANLAAYYAMVAVSLVVLTGWVGQISLGHAGLVGVGAFVTGHVINGLHITFPVNLLWAAAASGLLAALLGVVALRVRGLYLAVATLIFSWTAVEFLFRQEWLVRNAAVVVPPLGKPGTFPYFDWTSRRTYFYGAWAAVAAAMFLVANLRDSKTGRAFLAVRGSEVAAASLGISVVRTKLTAFAVSGAMAGMAGCLLVVRDGVVTPDAFKVEVSLFFLAIAVVGGLSSLGGAVAASLLFAALDEVFFRLEFLTGWLEVVPPVLLTAVLLLYRGGLAAFPGALRARLGLGRDAPLPTAPAEAAAEQPEESEEQAEPVDATPAPVSGSRAGRLVLPEGTWRDLDLDRPALDPDRAQRTPVVEAEGVTVRFGGLVAANDVSLKICEHEIVGLIGPNGAGKTTTFNAIAGLNVPSDGTVRIFGHDVTEWSVDERARLGVGRTFQAIQLLPQLTVFDNLLTATHIDNDSELLSHFFVGPATVEAERRARAQVRRVASLLELEDQLDRHVADLPFGVLRMVELARALVTASPLIMLDEPASGLDNNETARLAEILRFVRDLGVTLLLIEHDVQMVTSVSDYMYVLEYGKLLAEGTPAEIQRDPRVIAAYLGQSPEDAGSTTRSDGRSGPDEAMAAGR
jgi:branched-chain amino acid transport system permease protein